jgi:hypothetical protein
MVKRMAELDEESEIRDLTQEEWEERYWIEKEFQKILTDEELQWQRKGGEKWILQGDYSTGYSHKCANGRKRKMQIVSLEKDDQTISDPQLLKEHVTDYYKQLFGRVELADIHLEEDMWSPDQRITQQENDWLTRSFLLRN